MPIPFLLAGAAVVTGVAGIAKGGQAMKNNSEAKELIADAEYRYESAQEDLEKNRKQTSQSLDTLGEVKLRSWSDDISEFMRLFNSFKNVELTGNADLNDKLRMKVNNEINMKDMSVATLKAEEIVKAGVGSLGAGALAGIASYGGAMMFASASTGTAIASLSGAAATNATLAWFGGGSLAAGGLGMAGGTMVLGGIVAGPVLAVAGFIMAAKSEENLAKARKTASDANLAIEQMKIMEDVLRNIKKLSDEYTSFIQEFKIPYSQVLSALEKVHEDAYDVQKDYFSNKLRKVFGMEMKVNYQKLTQEQQEVIHLSWLMTQVYYNVLTSPLLTSEGNIDENAQLVLDDAAVSSNDLIGVEISV